MTNQEIAGFFHRLANLMELREDDPFRIRSYRMAAETIEDWPKPLAEIAADGATALRELPGVGPAISQKITALQSRIKGMARASDDDVAKLLALRRKQSNTR